MVFLYMGLSFYTALKFDTKDGKEAVINELIKYFKSVGLEQEFDGGSSFVVIENAIMRPFQELSYLLHLF